MCVCAHALTKTPNYLITRFSGYSLLFFIQRLVLLKSYIPLDLDRIYIIPLNLPQSLFAPLHAQEASKDNSKGEKGAKVEHKRVLENYLPQHNTSWTDAGETNGS